MKRNKKRTKYIFVTGGVVSSLGKGIASASIGRILENEGLKITIQKFDPYINVDPGTMSPYQHGEVYVTDDGAETDLDLGHYERYCSATMTQNNNATSGQIYETVIARERRGDYLGKTVQVVPHIIDEIKSRIRRLSDSLDVIITEIGGTVGDIESLPFLEAIRQFSMDAGRENVLYVHLTLVPYIEAAGELKTKPTQHSVGRLREIGIQPDILLCRTEKVIHKDVKEKIALFCNLKPDSVIQAKDVECVYEVPLMFQREGLDKLILRKLRFRPKKRAMTEWERVVHIARHPRKVVDIAVVGKYIEHQDAYMSIYEAIAHAGIANNCKVRINRIDAEKIIADGANRILKDVSGILIPGGFGVRGIEGKVKAIKFARENNIPFFGICLGMQCAVIEFARNVCGMKDANSTEFEGKTPYPVIHLLPSQNNIKDMGGTMRLGAYPCKLRKGSLSYKMYSREMISERHRHRYEFNNKYLDVFTQKGLIVSGVYTEENLAEIVEIKNHPWFVGCQFHPEFKSKPDMAHPLFKGFIKAAIKKDKR
jgi:CTP synthase